MIVWIVEYRNHNCYTDVLECTVHTIWSTKELAIQYVQDFVNGDGLDPRDDMYPWWFYIDSNEVDSDNHEHDIVILDWYGKNTDGYQPFNNCKEI